MISNDKHVWIYRSRKGTYIFFFYAEEISDCCWMCFSFSISSHLLLLLLSLSPKRIFPIKLFWIRKLPTTATTTATQMKRSYSETWRGLFSLAWPVAIQICHNIRTEFNLYRVGHFRVPLFPLWIKTSFICKFIFMQIKVIFIRKVFSAWELAFLKRWHKITWKLPIGFGHQRFTFHQSFYFSK